MSCTLTATLEQIPPDNTGRHTAAIDHRTTTAADYPAARREILHQLPQGWRIIAWRVHR